MSKITLFLFIAAVIPFLASTPKAQAEMQAAVAVRDVTPEKMLPVSGGAGPSEPAEKIVGTLSVRALVLENTGTRMAICNTDSLGFPGVLCDRVRASVPGIPPENILIGATHCHSAPDMYAFPDGEGGTGADLDYIGEVCDALAAAINEAVDHLQPARIKIATGDAKGKIAYNYYAPQLYDPRCHVIQALGADGQPMATLINYASHPEVIGPGQGIICPDFVGPLNARIETRGGGTCLYMNSAQGGMVTADCRGEDGEDIQTWEECIRIGDLLADEALRIVADAPVQENPPLSCKSTTINFPLESPLLRAILGGSPLGFEMNEDGTVPAQVNVVSLGNAQMLTIPGEALPNIGYYLKRKMHGEHNLLLGLTNEAFGYILTKEDWNSFDRYDYVSRTCLGEMTGEIFIEESLKFVDQCPRPGKLARSTTGG
jgi:hypothetical protein